MGRHTVYNQRAGRRALKRRVYIIGSALGLALSFLYAFSTVYEGVNIGFLATIGFMVELLLFLTLFVVAPDWMEVLELRFYFGMSVSIVLLENAQIYALDAKGVLIPDKLGFLVNGLVLWMLLYLLGAFLALPFQKVRWLLVVCWVGFLISAVAASLLLRPQDEWRYSYVLSWISGLVTLCMASIQINWLGQRQQHQATTDALTGIANRHQLSDQIAQYRERAASQNQLFVVMLIDVDHFKSINDTFGHATGDQVLQEVAATILQQIRGADKAGRWGGDEFLVLLADANAEIGQQVGERVRSAIDGWEGERAGPVTLTIGMHAATAAESIEQVLARADQALYAAKHAGRNQVRVWHPDDEHPADVHHAERQHQMAG